MSSHSPVAHAPIAVNHTPNGNLNGEPFEFDDITPGDVLNAPLEEVDPAIAAVLAGELDRQQPTLEMIASENFAPRAVLAGQGSVLTNKYAEGYPGKRYYGGCEYVDVVEQLAIDRASRRCSAPSTPTCSRTRARRPTPPSSSRCSSRATPSWASSLAHGGHLTHGMRLNFSGTTASTSSPTASNHDDYLIDMDELERSRTSAGPR